VQCNGHSRYLILLIFVNDQLFCCEAYATDTGLLKTTYLLT